MSISRKNWSALSSLARQRTVEDEEEVERERRRRVKSSSSSSDKDAPSRTTSTSDNSGSDSRTEVSQEPNSLEQIQLDFVEMLRVRDEKRRVRLVETLRKQKAEEEEEGEPVTSKRGERRGVTTSRAKALGNMKEEHDMVFTPEQTTSRKGADSNSSGSDVTNTSVNGELQTKDPDTRAKSSPGRKFVSSVSISLDKVPSNGGHTTPMSPGSPNVSLSPQESQPPPCQTPSPGGPQDPVQNGHTEESLHNSSFEQTSKPAFIRQSSRTLSFRMMKKDEDVSPLQRSASVRVATKRFENNTAENEEEKPSSFVRNSRQRISSRSIQEKLERLAQAAQKSEMSRPADVSHRTLLLLDEVSRKRGLFEKEEPQKGASSSPVTPRQDFRTLTSGISQGINQWMNKSSHSGSFFSASELRNVNINSKRSLFENRDEADGGVSNTRTVHVFK